MIKKIGYILILSLIILFGFFCIPSFATFEIEDFIINSVVLENGDLDVEEYITYNTTEKRNGVIRNIEIKNPDNKLNSADNVELENVSVDGLECEKINQGTNGDSGVYEYSKEKNGVKIKVYAPMVSGEYTVVYKYLLKNVAVKYNDTAELFWNFIGDGWDTDINNLKINITLPKSASNEKSYVFGHGSDNGRFTKHNNLVTLYASDINPNQPVDGRILFSRDSINSNKTVNRNVLNKYINQEEGIKLEKDPTEVLGLNVKQIAIYLAIGIIIFAIILYFKYDKEIYVEKHYYCREIPEGVEPEELQYIYNHRKVKNVIWTTFLNLIKKGVFTVRETENQVGKKVLEIEKTDKVVSLKSYQDVIKNFIISKMKRGKITDLELKAKLKTSLYSKYKKYEEKLKEEVESILGEETKTPKRVFIFITTLMICLIALIVFLATQSKEPGIAIGIAMFLIMTTFIYTILFKSMQWNIFTILFFTIHFGAFQCANIAMLAQADLGWMYLPYILLFIILQYSYRIKKVSKEERIIYEKAKGLKRYISDYSLLKEKELNDLVVWEDYLILAIALDVNKNVVNKLYDNIDTTSQNTYGTVMYYSMLDTSLRTSFADSIYRASSGGFGSGSGYSGSSGGFSGGSSSGGRRRRWWTEVHHSKLKFEIWGRPLNFT